MQDERRNHYTDVFLMARLARVVQSWRLSRALAKFLRIHTAPFQHHNLTLPGASAIPGGYISASHSHQHSDQLAASPSPTSSLCWNEGPARFPLSPRAEEGGGLGARAQCSVFAGKTPTSERGLSPLGGREAHSVALSQLLPAASRRKPLAGAAGGGGSAWELAGASAAVRGEAWPVLRCAARPPLGQGRPPLAPLGQGGGWATPPTEI